MNLSKAYDFLPNDLILAKVLTYGFDESAIILIANYLSTRYQRVNIGSYLEILRSVPQGSVLGPLLKTIL